MTPETWCGIRTPAFLEKLPTDFLVAKSTGPPFSLSSIPTPVFLSGESQGRGSLVGCRLWGHIESDMTEVT